MTVRSLASPTAPEDLPVPPWPAGGPALDTSELRWFAEGPIPMTVVDWFTEGASLGSFEQRVDSYLLSAREDLGIKRRNRSTLEAKLRWATDRPVRLASGLMGRVEHWRKWFPREVFDELQVWFDVHKRVFTRSFDRNGEAVSAPTDLGCEVEVAALSAHGIDAWTFALEARGPRPTRPAIVRAAAETLLGSRPLPRPLIDTLGTDNGYPAWLHLRMRRRPFPVPGAAS